MVMRTPVFLATLNIVLFGLSGCLGFLEDDPDEEDPAAPTHADSDTDPGGSEGEGNETQGDDPGDDQGAEHARLNGTVLMGNETVAGANVTLQPNGADADGEGLKATTGEEGRFLFEDLQPGDYTLTVNVTCCAGHEEDLTLTEGENHTVEIVLESLEADPEGGTASGLAVGASTVYSDRASFELTSDQHARIELIPESDDPLAQLGESYSFRLYLPDGEEENHDAVNGEPIVTESVMTGTYEITIWPAVAGAIQYTVDWCAHTTTHCEDG